MMGINVLKKTLKFIKYDIWRIQARQLPRKKSLWLNPLRIILLALRGFAEDKCTLRASALTYYTLFSIVPVVALAFGIAKGFGLEKILERQLIEKFHGHEEVLSFVLNFANRLLDNTKGGVVAGIGVVILFWTVIKLLGNIETSFNDIWGIKQARPIGRKFTDYLAFMLICPFLFILSSSATVFLSSKLQYLAQNYDIFGIFNTAAMLIIEILPYCVIWLLFSFIYIFMPNTKVNLSSGIIAGILAGTIYQLIQMVYIASQIGVSKYNAIYGSFAALPMFLFWVQISWLIVLFGAEISFACQNVETYEFEPDSLRVSNNFKHRLTLLILNLIVKNFASGEKPLDADEISHRLEIPIRLVRQIVFDCVRCHLLQETKGEKEKDATYQPATSIDKYTIKFAMNTLESFGEDNIPLPENTELAAIAKHLESLDSAVNKLPDNCLLKDI